MSPTPTAAIELDLVWVLVDKRRPGIVMRVRDGRALVLFGTGTPSPDPLEIPDVVIEPASDEGRALALTKTTYFRKRNIALPPVTDLASCGRCRPELFLALRSVLEHGRKR